MGTPVRYLNCEKVDIRTGMTEHERIEQLISRVYGNVHVEHSAVTMEFVRKVVQERLAAGTVDAIVIH